MNTSITLSWKRIIGLLSAIIYVALHAACGQSINQQAKDLLKSKKEVSAFYAIGFRKIVRGSSAWDGIVRFLAREPSNHFKELRKYIDGANGDLLEYVDGHAIIYVTVVKVTGAPERVLEYGQ